MCLHSNSGPLTFHPQAANVVSTHTVFINLNCVVCYFLQTSELQFFTLCVDLSVRGEAVTLTVAFVTLDACVLCMISPLPACADSACLPVCVLTCSRSLSLPPHPHPSSHRPCVPDPGCLSAARAADPGGRGLVRVPHPAPGQQD